MITSVDISSSDPSDDSKASSLSKKSAKASSPADVVEFLASFYFGWCDWSKKQRAVRLENQSKLRDLMARQAREQGIESKKLMLFCIFRNWVLYMSLRKQHKKEALQARKLANERLSTVKLKPTKEMLARRQSVLLSRASISGSPYLSRSGSEANDCYNDRYSPSGGRNTNGSSKTVYHVAAMARAAATTQAMLDDFAADGERAAEETRGKIMCYELLANRHKHAIATTAREIERVTTTTNKNSNNNNGNGSSTSTTTATGIYMEYSYQRGSGVAGISSFFEPDLLSDDGNGNESIAEQLRAVVEDTLTCDNRNSVAKGRNDFAKMYRQILEERAARDQIYF